MLAEVGKLTFDELSGRRRDEYLSAVATGGDTGGAVDVISDVALVGEKRRPGVQADTHGDRAGGERIGEGRRRRECSRCGRKGEEEGIALSVDFDPALRGTRLADHTAMLGERVGVGPGAELVQQTRRALDVGEEEGDSARGEVATHGRIMRQLLGA